MKEVPEDLSSETEVSDFHPDLNLDPFSTICLVIDSCVICIFFFRSEEGNGCKIIQHHFGESSRRMTGICGGRRPGGGGVRLTGWSRSSSDDSFFRRCARILRHHHGICSTRGKWPRTQLVAMLECFKHWRSYCFNRFPQVFAFLNTLHWNKTES